MIDSDTLSFLFFLTAIWWIVGSIGVGKVATKKKLSGWLWFLCGLIFGPFLAALLLIAHPQQAAVEETANTEKLFSGL